MYFDLYAGCRLMDGLISPYAKLCSRWMDCRGTSSLVVSLTTS